jgi:secreted trypsin-like serine protease
MARYQLRWYFRKRFVISASAATILAAIWFTYAYREFIFFGPSSNLLKDNGLNPKYPSIVFINSIIANETQNCVGTLIDKNFVLTAAHCVHGATSVLILLGTNDLTNNLEGQQRDSTKFIIHEDYNSVTLDNDIALIYLDQEVPLSDNINVAILSSRDYRSYSNFYCVVPGWGSLVQTENLNDVVLEKHVKIIGIEKCSMFFDEMGEAKICARGSTTPCHGDSGAPLLCRNEQAGVVSGGAKYCNQSAPSVYTNVFYYTHWIQKEIENYLK